MPNAKCEVWSRYRVGRGLVAVILSALLAAVPALAADDPVQKALRAYEKNRYEDAWRHLRAALPALEQGKQSQAQLALGMISLKNAELHRQLLRASMAVNTDHLMRLASDHSRSRSRYSDLYLGLALLEAGQPAAAKRSLEKFVARGGDSSQVSLASCALGIAEYRTGDKEKARDRWNRASGVSDPDVKSELAWVWSGTGKDDRKPLTACDGAVAAARKRGPGISIITMTNCLDVYARAGQLDKARDLLRNTDLKAFSYRESLGRSKVILFYDIRLMGSLANYYLRESLAALEKAANDPTLSNIAYYYLGEAQVLAGNAEQASKATSVFLGAPQAPQQYRNRALVRQGALQYQMGRQADAIRTWDELVKSQKDDPNLLGDVLLACGGLGIACPRPAQVAGAAVEKGQGKRFTGANIGLGRYWFARKDYGKALAYLEAGRDKGNKNKIEYNDPSMLVDLAECYYRSGKYSEALEIYFEMSKEFPEVRQIQEALQGVYVTEHRSAGDVKIN